MGITGSVLATLSAGVVTQVTLPMAGMHIVAVWHGAPYISIPLNSSRNAILPQVGAFTASGVIVAAQKNFRKVDWVVDGTNLNVFSPVNCTAVFYYGSPLAGSRPLTSYAGITTKVTLVSSEAVAEMTFPSGNLRLVGIAATDETTTGKYVIMTWSTSPGQLFFAQQPPNTVTPDNDDIYPLDMPVAQILNINVTGNSTDVIDIYAYYQ